MDVFLTSPWIPVEWVRAHGLEPRGLWSAENFQPGAWPLSAGVCALAEAAVRFAGARPDSPVIFSTACDQLRRGFDTAILRGQRRAFLFNLPATWQTAAAGQIFRAELERLGQFLLALGGHAPSSEDVRREMLRSSRTRKLLLDSAPAASPRGFAESVARFHWDGSFSPPPLAAPESLATSSGARSSRPPPSASRRRNLSLETSPTQIPLALFGGPFPAPHWKLLDELEAAGGRVVLNATEAGERSLSPAFEFEAGANHSFDALVRGYCDNIIDVFQRPNTRLYSWLKPRLASRKARGIVLWHFTGCDLWRAEAPALRETFGLPLLLLEAGAEAGAAPRQLNRLQAFMESLR